MTEVSAKSPRSRKSKPRIGRTPWRAIFKRSFDNAWATAAPLVAFVLVAWIPLRNWLPDNSPYKDALPATITAFLFVVYAGFEVRRWAVRSRAPVMAPDNTKAIPEFFARPYDADSGDLKQLSKFANEVFEGDTMKTEVVRDAVAKKAALGLRLTTSENENIGFFDVFHLRPNALRDWINGDLSEPDMTTEHFEPILERSPELQLIIGAIYLRPEYRLGPLAVAFADLCRNYLRDSCPGFDRIVLYASIFSEEGEKLARFYKFRIHKDKEERSGVAKDKHDVRMLELRADDKKSVRSAGGHFVIHMDW